MSPPEISLLVLGLVVGAAFGGALMEAFHSRPVRRREIRLTVSPNSIAPRRASTLASADPMRGRGPIPGSPVDDDWLERRLAGTRDGSELAPAAVHDGSQNRTRVSFTRAVMPSRSVAVPVYRSGPIVRRSPLDRIAGPDTAPRHDAAPAALARPAAPSAVLDRAVPGMDEGRSIPGVVVRHPTPGVSTRPSIPATAVAVAIEPAAPPDAATADLAPPDRAWARLQLAAEAETPHARAGAHEGDTPMHGSADAPSTTASTACEAERHLLEERCALAEAAQAQARVAADTLREAQRAYDLLRERVERAQALSDPREIRASKDAIHRTFRSARAAAATTEDVEAAAREWLNEINRLNTAAREAAHVAETGSAELRAQLPRLERLSVEADAARITAEGAQVGCQEARSALARCEELAALAASAAAQAAGAAAAATVPSTLDGAWPTEGEEPPLRSAIEVEEQGGATAVIVRILRGDRPARERLIAALAGGDAEAGRQWHLRIAGLVDAIMARAIEAGYLDLPEEGFWGLFTQRERREIVGALSALGYRFDGLGGFADGRIPAQRDLSLAVGYAGLDRMRIRNWPREAELATLYDGATVAGDEWLADEAGDLSLGRMVDALGARAAELADVWNAWGRVRPALLATD